MNVKQFKKKPIVVNAIQWLGYNEDEVCEFANRSKCCIEIYRNTQTIKITGFETSKIVMPDDWIIMGVKGELYPCSPIVFDEIYDEVQE